MRAIGLFVAACTHLRRGDIFASRICQFYLLLEN
jgi:hypothetical protein